MILLDQYQAEIQAVIGIGSNTPDRFSRVEVALTDLAAAFRLSAKSSVYATTPFSGTGNPYANAVAVIDCRLSADELKQWCKQYENDRGRDRKTGNVAIDLDVVYYGSDCLRPHEINRDYFTRGMNEIRRKG